MNSRDAAIADRINPCLGSTIKWLPRWTMLSRFVSSCFRNPLMAFRPRLGSQITRPRRRQSRFGRRFTDQVLQSIELLECRILLTAVHSVYDGSYVGTFSGTNTYTDSSGNQTVTQIPGPTFTNNALDETISNGVVSYVSPGDSGSGSGTIDPQTGKVAGTGTALIGSGQVLSVQFVGQAEPTSAGMQITGTWSEQGTFSDGSSDVGSGTWIVLQPAPPKDQWTGANVAVDTNWSDGANWSLGGATDNRADGVLHLQFHRREFHGHRGCRIHERHCGPRYRQHLGRHDHRQ